MVEELTKAEMKNILASTVIESAFSDENDKFTSLSTSALLAKNAVPQAHKRVADNYMVIKRIYKFQVVQSRISNQELALLKKYDFNPLEYTTIKQVNEELSYLKKWSFSANETLAKDADEIIQIRAKELKFLSASNYYALALEAHNGYKALERYFEEISKFCRH